MFLILYFWILQVGTFEKTNQWSSFFWEQSSFFTSLQCTSQSISVRRYMYSPSFLSVCERGIYRFLSVVVPLPFHDFICYQMSKSRDRFAHLTYIILRILRSNREDLKKPLGRHYTSICIWLGTFRLFSNRLLTLPSPNFAYTKISTILRVNYIQG